MADQRARDSDSGVFVSTFSDTNLLDVLHTESPVQAKDIASEFGCSTRNARMRLNTLVDDEKATVEWIGPTKLYHPD